MPVKVGRLLQSGIGSFKVAVPASQIDALAYGALVVVPVTPELSIFRVVADISFESDPLIRVMAGAIDTPQSTFESLRGMLARLEPPRSPSVGHGCPHAAAHQVAPVR